MKERVSGRVRSPAAPLPQSDDRQGGAEASVGGQEEAVFEAARDGAADEVEDGVFDGVAQQGAAQQAVEGAGAGGRVRAAAGGVASMPRRAWPR